MRARDDELAEEIVRELCPRRVTPSAVGDVKSRIRTLRKVIRQAKASPRPSAAKKTIAQIVKYAQAIADRIEKLDYNRRCYLLLEMFGERDLRFANKDELKLRMAKWVSDLREAMNFSPSKPKDLCARAARDIIFWLASKELVNKGEKFYRTASLLWEAATGEREKSLKRACDYQIDLIKAHTGHTAGRQHVRAWRYPGIWGAGHVKLTSLGKSGRS